MARRGDAARRRALSGALATLLASGCALSRAIPAADLPESGEQPPADAGAGSKLRVEAGSPRSPILRCGPQDSYRYVASTFRCPDGVNPLAGDAEAAARARVGSLAPDARGRTVDVYEVPCPSGKVEVYIDMYDCPEMEEELARDLAMRDPFQLDVLFADGRYDEVRARCNALASDAPAKTAYHCTMLEPALQLRVNGGQDPRKVSGEERCGFGSSTAAEIYVK